MMTKTGNKFPCDSHLTYAAAVGEALRSELGASHRAIKTLRQWTDANERTAKHWLAGTHGPSGTHLIALARHSDQVLHTLLSLAERRASIASNALPSLREKLVETLMLVDDCLTREAPSPERSNADEPKH
ncbi:MAG: hypothetical protein WA173_18715 [Pseudomonas sp.]|uniref:hypothetical protein n=1 Tax=Pseudomonas sp. TaxID=306 RepID=UPI003BB67031